MIDSLSTFIGGFSIGAVGTLVVQQIASTPAPDPPVVPTPALELVPVVSIVLIAIAIWGAILYGPRP